MFRRLLQILFIFLAFVKANNATLSFNAPQSYLGAATSMSVDQCGTTHNIKPVSVSSTDGQAPIFSIREPAGESEIYVFGVINNENLRCIDKSALQAAGITTYILKIEVSSATESAISFTFELTITGLPTNPSTPTFTPTSHSLTISANKFDEEGEFTLGETFVVTDPDPGAAGTLTYSLKDSPAEFGFTSDSGTVSIQVKRSTLDLPSPYELVVIATDQGTPPRTGSATMTITLDINDCIPNPCQNNGACIDAVQNYTCNCPEGFRGYNCTEDIDDCTPNPCQNNGTCIDAVQHYTCYCPEGFHGYKCTEVNSCSILSMGPGLRLPFILIVGAAIFA